MFYINQEENYFKKSPVVGLINTAHEYCEAFTNGYGTLKMKIPYLGTYS